MEIVASSDRWGIRMVGGDGEFAVGQDGLDDGQTVSVEGWRREGDIG